MHWQWNCKCIWFAHLTSVLKRFLRWKHICGKTSICDKTSRPEAVTEASNSSLIWIWFEFEYDSSVSAYGLLVIVGRDMDTVVLVVLIDLYLEAVVDSTPFLVRLWFFEWFDILHFDINFTIPYRWGCGVRISIPRHSLSHNRKKSVRPSEAHYAAWQQK